MNANTDPFEELHADIVALWESAPLPKPVAFGDGGRERRHTAATTAVGWGWLVRIIRTGQAAVLLEKQGFGAETAPMMRSILEHTIRLVYASKVGFEAIEVGLRERAQSIVRLRRAQESGWHLGDDFLDQLSRAEKEASEEFRHLDNFAHLAQVVKLYPGLGKFYMAWLLETQASHPTLASSQPYFQGTPGSNEIELWKWAQETSGATTAQVCVTLLAAMKAYANIAGLVGYFKQPIVALDFRLEALWLQHKSAVGELRT